MRYHNITKRDILNGEGYRVVLWVAGCNHHCKNCQNPETWSICGGIPFDEDAKKELLKELEDKYTKGITFSGGDPLHPINRHEVGLLIMQIKKNYPNKDIWLYTGYLWEEIIDLPYIKHIDVLVDGPYKECERDVSLKWIGSKNQRVIDVKKSLAHNKVVLFCENEKTSNYSQKDQKSCGC